MKMATESQRKNKMLENINTALEWEEGVINFDTMTGKLYIMDDSEYDDMYKLAIEEGDTTLSDDDFAREVCKNALFVAFRDDEIVKAGMNWDNPEHFKNMLLDEKEEIERMQKERKEYEKEMEEDARNIMLDYK
jgi:hypothetical protein